MSGRASLKAVASVVGAIVPAELNLALLPVQALLAELSAPDRRRQHVASLHQRLSDTSLPEWGELYRLPIDDVVRLYRGRAITVRHFLPSREKLSGAAAAFRDIAFGRTDEMKSRALLGLMLDAMPSARAYEASATFVGACLDIMVHDDADRREVAGFKGFTPQVIAVAVRQTLRESTFAPSIAEFLKRAHEARYAFCSGRVHAHSLIDLHDRAGDLLFRTGDLKESDDDFQF